VLSCYHFLAQIHFLAHATTFFLLTALQSYVYSTPYSICITETWLPNSIFDCETLPCEYTLYHEDRGSRGGGVLIAVSDSVPSVLISSPEVLEFLSVTTMNLHIPKVKIKSHKHPKWYNSNIRHHLNCIRTLRKRCISHPTIHNSSKLQLSETQIQHKMLAAKANF